MYIKVLVELSAFNIDKTFTYRVNNDFDKIKIGIRVLVPFNNQKLEGFVLDIMNEIDVDYEVKDIIKVIDSEVILNDELLELGRWLSHETLSTLISSYQAMLPKALKAKRNCQINIKYEKIVEIDNLNITLTDKQQQIIDKINEKGSQKYSVLKKINSSVDTLIKKGILRVINRETYRRIDDDVTNYPKHILNDEQKNAYLKIKEYFQKEKTFLLWGITGSGKTEVYLELMEDVIKNGQQVLFLVPEITLTNQLLKRISSRFKNIAVLHSMLSDGERYDEYRRIKKGEANLVIGTRSSVFAPLNNIGLIIIDESHTNSYQQDNMPKYDAIEVSKWRSHYHNCPLVLGSATPTLEMYARSQKNLYELIPLTKRAGKAILPEIILCDMTKEKRMDNTIFSKMLYDSINEKLKKKEQIILLQNRRGYSSSIMCQNCGFVMKCPNCDINMTYHKGKGLMRCHYCGYATKEINVCPNCHMDCIRELGSGTEKVEEELKQLFPSSKIVRMDLDTTVKKGSHNQIIEAFSKGEYDILLGTQMIAKGLDFPNVTLVGVLNADTSLFIPSYKSSEDTFQLISQVSGRSGRSEKRGTVIIQTYNKDHYAITCAKNNDYLSFYKEEMKNRLIGKYPPFFYLVEVVLKSKNYDLVSREINKVFSILNNQLQDVSLIGPSMCLPFKVNNYNRFRVIIKYKKENNLKKVLKELIDHYKVNNQIIVEISFNPTSL